MLSECRQNVQLSLSRFTDYTENMPIFYIAMTCNTCEWISDGTFELHGTARVAFLALLTVSFSPECKNDRPDKISIATLNLFALMSALDLRTTQYLIEIAAFINSKRSVSHDSVIEWYLAEIFGDFRTAERKKSLSRTSSLIHVQNSDLSQNCGGNSSAFEKYICIPCFRRNPVAVIISETPQVFLH